MVGLRCSVKSLAEFAASSRPAKVTRYCTEPEVFIISNGTSQVFTCGSVEHGVTASHQFPGRVTQIVPSAALGGVYTLCERDGIYFTPLPQLRSSTQPFAPSLGGCLRVSAESRVVQDREIQTFLVVKKVLVTVALGVGVWRFSLYEVPALSLPHCRKLAEVSIPAVSTAGLSTAARSGHQGVLPVLCCVQVQSRASTPLQEDGHFLLEPLIFGLLFGLEASLVSSPMILCGLPDGQLCSLPLLLPGGSEVRGQAHRVRILYSLEQPIMFIGALGGAGGGDSNLVVVGREGAILQVRAEDGPEGRVAGFEQSRVQGPIECVSVSCSHLYYSTCSDLLALPLTCGSPSPEAHLDPPSPATQSPVSLNVSRILALTTPTLAPTGAVQLVAVSLRGRLLQVMLPQGSGGGCVPRLPAAQVGQRVKDLLASIGNVSDRALLLKNSIQSRSVALQHLNHIFNISCLLQSSQGAGGDLFIQERPIRCCVTVRWASLMAQDVPVLSCVLKNCSSFLLGPGWVLCVQQQVTPTPHATLTDSQPPSCSHAFPLQRLAPGQSLQLALPLAARGELLLPVTVQCWLVCSLPCMLGLPEVGWMLGDSACLCLPLDSLTVDWLHCLRVEGPGSGSTPAAPVSGSGSAPAAPVSGSGSAPAAPGSSPATDLVWTFLSSRGAEPQKGLEVGVSEAGLFVASIQVSSELLKGVLGTPTSPASLSLCQALLSWLVRAGSGRESREDPGGAAVCARTAEGEWLRLTAEEVQVSQVCGKWPISALELRMESTSLKAVCGLHHATLCRLHALLKEGSVAPQAPLQGERLQQVLLLDEALCEEIQESRRPSSLGVVTSERTTHKLIHLYQRLRESSLLIL